MDKVRVFVILSHVSYEYRKLFIRLQRRSASKDQKPEFDPGLLFSNFMEMSSPLSTDSVARDINKESEIKCDWSYKVDVLNLYASQLHDRVRKESKPIPCDDIRQRLDFMYKPDDVVQSNIERKYYIKPTTFQTYFEGVTANITGERFNVCGCL